MQFGNTNSYGQGFQTPVSAPFMSSPFSLFSGGIPALVSRLRVSTGVAQTIYTTPNTNNPLAYGWNPFQSSPTTSQPTAGGNPTFTFGNQGKRPYTSQTHTFHATVRPKLPFLETLKFPYLCKLNMMPLGHLSLPIYPRTFQNSREKLVKTQGIISPPFTCGALPTRWMMKPFG